MNQEVVHSSGLSVMNLTVSKTDAHGVDNSVGEINV